MAGSRPAPVGVPYGVLVIGAAVVLGSLVFSKSRNRREERRLWAEATLSHEQREAVALEAAVLKSLTPVAAASWDRPGIFLRLMSVAALGAIVGLFLANPPLKLRVFAESDALTASAGASTVDQPSPSADSALIVITPPAPPITSGPRALSSLDVHIGPATGYLVVGSLPRGARLEVIGRDETGEWLAIVFSPGSKLNGWVPRKDVGNVSDVRALPVAKVTLLQ